MTPAPNRRWFRWSLRTTLLVVTVLACWLHSNWLTINQRRQTLAALQYDGCTAIDGREPFWAGRFNPSDGVPKLAEMPSVPAVRRWLSDEPIGFIRLLFQYTDADQDRIQKQFPEAVVMRVSP